MSRQMGKAYLLEVGSLRAKRSVVASAPAKTPEAVFSYILVPGDTLYGVSRRFGIPKASCSP